MARCEGGKGRRTRPVIGADEPGADLWERPPAPPLVCQGCGLKAEPFVGQFCWCCWHNGQAKFVLSGPLVFPSDRAVMLGDPGAA